MGGDKVAQQAVKRGQSRPLKDSYRDAALAISSALDGGASPELALDAAATELFYTGLRHTGLARVALKHWANRPPAPEVQALFSVALAELRRGEKAAFTVVDQAVEALVQLPGGKGTQGFLNALLRRATREPEQLADWEAKDETARFNAPAAWIRKVRQALGEDSADALDAMTVRPPLTLRVNRRRIAAAAWIDLAAQAGLTATQIGPSAVRLAQPRPVSQIPGFIEGLVSVQDASAQQAAFYLNPAQGSRVLDACAAPGGKTAHLLELADLDLLALDVDAKRLARVQANLERLGLRATLRQGDVLQPQSWWDGEPFDHILLDAPCSGSGVVRRHPEIPWIRTAQAVARASRQQGQMMKALWPLLRPGGTLLFVTCSIFPEEGDELPEAFCTSNPDAACLPIPRRIMPCSEPQNDRDGFSYALFEKLT